MNINPLNKKPHILVIGDLMLDHYLWGACERISPEAPVQVVNVNNETIVLGGAGNVVNNLRALGSEVSVLSVIGDDEAGGELLKYLSEADADCENFVYETGRKTSKKSRIIAGNQQIVRYDNESKYDISSQSEEALILGLKKLISSIEILILSDYGKGVLTPKVTPKLIDIAREAGVKVLVDPKGTDYSKYKNATMITPNKKEASESTGLTLDSIEKVKEAGFKLKESLALDTALITLSEDGIAIFDSEMRIHPTVAQEVFDVTGAGDTVIASLAFALATNNSIDDAVIFANAAAAVVVGKLGSATATIEEINIYNNSLGQHDSHAYIKSFEEIACVVNSFRDKKIVFTNGCFDILHAGHVTYLEKAKSFGDLLIVGVNADSSVRKLKGESRPINNEQDRAYLLSALHAVDYVVIFDQETPLELIKIVQPDVLVKGGDYEGKEVVGSKIASEVKLVDFVNGKSTTKTIEKIQKDSVC